MNVLTIVAAWPQCIKAAVASRALRDEKEWVEMVESGWNQLCPLRFANDVAETIASAFDAQGQDDAAHYIARALPELEES